VRKPLSASRVALLAFGVLSLFGSAAYGQDRDRRDDGRRDDGRHDEVRGDEHPDGIVQDWSHRHLVFPRVGPIHNLIAIQHDQRALLSWQDSWRREWRRGRNPWHFHRTEPTSQPTSHIDWSISLGSGTTAKSMFPAKFTFDKNATPVCATDFAVFAVNATAAAAQPNLVAFNNLYSGTLGGTGICNAPADGRTVAAGVDDGVSATTLWSYSIKAAGGQVSTSPALSLDGTKVAFVETAPATTAHFHVLAWKSGDGVPTNLQAPATAPLQITSGFDGNAPVAGSGNVTDLALGTNSDTLSSPFIEYNTDQAYVGSDNGVLYRISNVFCTGISTPCTPGTSTGPALDGSWGTAGGLATGCSGRLTGAVVDAGTGNIFVGCSDGKLYGFTPAGLALSNSPVTVGDGSATGGIVDTPLIDVTNEFVYVVSGNDGTNQVVVQASTVDLSGKNVATLNPGGLFNLHAPAFNEAYLSGTGTPLLYEMGGSAASGGEFTLFGITFGALDVMNTGTPAHVQNFTFGAFELSPMTEFFDGTTDRLFESTIGTGASLAEFDITSTFPTAPVGTPPTEGTGTTGIIVDNSSTQNQARSVYFGVLTSNTAVKLTQVGEQ
jgi:hypothetical protein